MEPSLQAAKLDITKIDHLINQYLIPFGWKIIGAFAVWILGSLVIRAIQKMLNKGLNRKNVDPTLAHYAHSILGVALKALLIIAILGIFGIETTSFSAVLAAAGVAVGMAWSGLLANFAAGVFLVLFRPFKVGDVIAAAGVTGVVQEIGMFATTIDTDVNVKIFVGNNKIFSDNILNYSANHFRIAVFKVQLAPSVSPTEAISFLKQKLQNVPGIFVGAPQHSVNPVISGEISELNAQGVLITLKVPCSTGNYGSVLAQGYEIIHRALTEARYPHAENRVLMVDKV